jgi:hypothetical protein
MAPSFALFGCGPEGFRKAFLAYKSTELARLSPKANNESPHSAYLEAMISHGIVGASLYAAMIWVALILLVRARRVPDGTTRWLTTGVLSSLIAVLVHNIFIFDQIATGLYFFAFIGLAQAVSNVTARKSESGATEKPGQVSEQPNSGMRTNWSILDRLQVFVAAFLILPFGMVLLRINPFGTRIQGAPGYTQSG